MKTKLRIFILIYFVLLLLFSSRTVLHAQETQALDLTVSPQFFDFIGVPGGEIIDKIRVRNNTNNTVPLKIDIQKMVGKGETGEATFETPKPTDDYIKWLKVENSAYNARPKEWTDIPFTITIPKDAAFGYYYAFVISPDTGNIPQGSRTTKLTGAVAVMALLNIKAPGAQASAKLVDFKASSFINEYLPINFLVRINNTGNVHLKPRGNIFIRGGKEKDLAVLEVNPAMGSILPQGFRVFDNISWNDGFLVRQPVMEDGKIKLDKKGYPVSNLTFNWNKLTSMRIGHFTAHLVMVFDDGKRDVPIEGTTSFWVIPYKVIIASIIGLVVLIIIIRFFLHRYINQQLKKHH